VPTVVRSIALPFLAAALCAAAATPARADSASIVPQLLPAAGRSSAILTVPAAGRYAITATSATGTALQLVDRQAGPGGISGAAGERDGRVDRLLERGTYQLVTRGPEKAGGEVVLAARPFVEAGAAPPAMLVEGKPVAAELGDFEQRSWWLQVDAARRVILEAAGRNLSDLRLFRDGGWLVDAEPVLETVEPEAGRPLRSCRIVAALEPGLYLLSAYGGPDEPWPAGGGGHPLHLRVGIPALGEAGRTRYRVSPFGADHFVVPGNVTFVQLELPEATDAELAEAPFPAEGDPFGEARLSAEVTKKHREPVATLEPEAQDGPRLLTVRAAAGQPYVLQHFELRDPYTFQRSGRYWIGSLHSGHPQDSADATAIVTAAGSSRRGVEPRLAQAIEIGASRGWARRCNLLDTLTVFFRVRDTGSYEVLLRGDAEARARFEPFLVSRPHDYQEPGLRPAGAAWQLEAGWYVLTVVPEKPGIVEAAVRPVGKLDAIWDLLDPGRPMRGEPVRPAVTFPAAELDWNEHYTVHLNRRPGVRSGLVVRQLPIDLVRFLPLALVPGEEVTVASRVPEAGTIRAETEAGESLELRAGAGAWLQSLQVAAGTFDVRVRNRGPASVLATLRFDAERLREDVPLPAVPPGALLPPPEFPTISEGAPRFFDLDRDEAATFAVRVDQPAFQTVETTGLLATAGTLRSRLVPTLAAADSGGTGRNFLVGSFLGEGDYQLTVQTQGASSGHLGVRLRRAPLRDGGSLVAGRPTRVSVGAAEGVLHTFDITEGGTYRLGASAVGRPLPCRLEDADGWPIAAPGIPARFEQPFEPGRYRLLLLPEAVGSRRVTLLERVADPPRFEGHGPHPLELDRPIEHVWLEPAADSGAERPPDRWEFALPAPATLQVALSGEMQGEIRRRDDPPGAAPVALVPPGRAWSGPIAAGAYALEARCSRRNNRNPYEIAIRTEQLLAGSSRDVVAPVTLPVSVGAGGLFEFASSGTADVQARLVEQGGATVAEQQDRPDDWNVQLAARLSPGAYRLELAPTGAESAPTRIAMRAIGERQEPPLALPGGRDVRPGDDVAVVPLGLPPAATLLVVRASAEEILGAALDQAVGDGWATLWSGQDRALGLELPLPAAEGARREARYRLRLWSLDRRGGAIRVDAAGVVPRRVTERELAQGATVEAVGDAAFSLAVAEVALDRPGLVRLDGATAWRASGAANHPLAAAAPGAALAGPGARLSVAATLAPGAREAVLTGQRAALTTGEPLSVELPAGGAPILCDLELGGPGPAMVTVVGASGQPAVGIVPGKVSALPATSAVATAVPAEGSATALVAGAGAGGALVWQADPSRPAARVTLRLSTFSAQQERALAAGTDGGSIERGGARRFALPGGEKRLRLSLGPGLAAALVREGRTESAHDAGDGALAETIESAAEALVIVNAGGSAASWSLEALPLDRGMRAAAVGVGAPYAREAAAAGTLRVPIGPDGGEGAGLRLRAAGFARDPVYLAADGRILLGSDFAVGSGGTLLLPHGPGLAAAWVDRPGGVSGIWGDAPRPRERAAEGAGVFRLDGPSTGLAVKSADPAVLRLRTESPLLGVIRRPTGATQGVIQQRAATLELYLAPGTTTLWLRPAAGGELRGSAEALVSPVTALGEGLGPEVLLAPGTTRYFSIAVAAAGPVGIGVRAAPDTATCQLLDAAGRPIGEGIVQMPDLTPGVYLLAVRAPEDGGPVTVRPALAGLVPPGTGPPADVVRRYLELAGGGTEDSGPVAPGNDSPEGAEGD
jgi:hypothetical protein